MKNNRGVALLLALFILLIVSALVIGFLELSTSDLQITNNLLNRNKALFIADAGIEYAVSQLRNNRSNFSTSIEFPTGSGHRYIVTYSQDLGRITSGTMTSIGRLVSGEEVSLEARVTVRGASTPYEVRIISYREL